MPMFPKGFLGNGVRWPSVLNGQEGLLGERSMTKLGKALTAALIGAGTLAISAGSASAAVVCNGYGECWHTHRHYNYPARFGIVVHDDNWRWGHRRHYRWHEHDGRGYWRNGIWVTF